MTVNHWVHLGPYLLCKFGYRTVKVPEEDIGCSRGHSVPVSASFCPECGLPTNWATEKSVPTVNGRQLTIQIDNELIIVGTYRDGNSPDTAHDVRIPNWVYRHEFIDRRLVHDLFAGNTVQEIDATIIEQESLAFECQFKESIEYLQSKYMSCEIKWGMIIYGE